MSKSSSVEIQKGPIDPNPMTSKQMTHAEKLREATEQNNLRRHGSKLDLHEPKSRRK